MKMQMTNKQDLVAINIELTLRAQEWNIAASSKHQWKTLYEEIKQDKQEALRKLCDLQVRFDSMEHQMKETVLECEERIQ